MCEIKPAHGPKKPNSRNVSAARRLAEDLTPALQLIIAPDDRPEPQADL